MKLAVCLLTVVFLVFPASAARPTPEEQAIARSNDAIGRLLPSMTLTDTEGRQINLTELRGKPLLISLVYTGCTDSCPAIIENLRPAIEIGQEALGIDSFTTITVGFNTRYDTPERMRSFARSRGIDLPNWLFLSGDQGTVEKLADAVGFTIIPSAGGFDHMAQVSVVDAQGRIYQQIRGGVFNPPTVVEPLKDLLFDRRRDILTIAGITERIKLFCTVYNPNTGRYYFNYSLFIGIAIGIACLSLVLISLVREFRPTSGSNGSTHS